ncbi:MAG: CDP-alcohol phosphatidyltransferase family protein, partial [Acidimicrobiales bacterium]
MSTSESDRSSWRSQVLTWPNLISLVRLACIPLFVWLLLGEERRVAAGALLAVLGATDWVDGYVARRFNQVSEVGKILDPTADRLMFLVAMIAMLIDGSVPIWFGILTLVREAGVAIVALILGAMGARRIDVTRLGKTSTFGLMVTFPLFLLGAAGTSVSGVAEAAAYLIGVPSLALHYY